MRLTILNPKHVLFDEDVRSVFLPGDTADFEILDFHAPILSLLRKGNVIVDWEQRVPIEKGIVKFNNNECMILAEEQGEAS